MQFKILTYINFFFLFLIMQFSLLNFHCKKPTPPDIDDTPKPGKRDYTWTIDTLAYPGSFQTLMRDIWASSPTNVYVVGHNDQGGQGTMFRFDGNKWRAVDLGSIIIGGITLSAIYGFGPNDIYVVGQRIYDNPAPPPNFLDSSLIIHFDGTKWSEIQIVRARHLSCIWGASPNDVWFGGSWGSLYHYDGIKTKKIQFDSLASLAYIAGFSPTNIYSTCVKKNDFVSPEDSSLYLLYHYSGESWLPIDSFIITPNNLIRKFGLSLWGSENGRLYSASYGVYILENGIWRQLLSSDWPVSVRGSSDQNIYAVGGLGRIFHWNGIDWKRWVEIEDQNKILTRLWTNNVETFIIGHDGYKTFIIHGR